MIRELAPTLGFPSERVFDISVAVSEAVANAIEHAPQSGEVRVEAEVHPDRLEVHVGGPGEFRLPESERDREHRGLGLPLMATLADHLALYSRAEGGTRVALTFYLPEAERSTSPLPPSLVELLSEHALFDEVLDRLPDPFVIYDREWRYLYVNDKTVENTGRSREELLGQVRWDVFPERDSAFRYAHELAMTTRRPVATVSYYEPTDSWWESRAFPVPDGLAVLYRDITQRKRAEEEAAEQLRNLEILSASATHLLQPVPSSDVFQYAARQLRSVVGRALVAISEYHVSRNQTEVKALVGPEEKLEALVRILGRDPVGLVFTVAEGTRERMARGALSHVEGGLCDLTFGQMPASLCRLAEEQLELGDIYAMPFALEGDFLGTVAILTDKAEGLRNRTTLEPFVNQVALALRRNRAEEALRKGQAEDQPPRR